MTLVTAVVDLNLRNVVWSKFYFPLDYYVFDSCLSLFHEGCSLIRHRFQRMEVFCFLQSAPVFRCPQYPQRLLRKRNPLRLLQDASAQHQMLQLLLL